MKSAVSLVAEIDSLQRNFRLARAYFPYMDSSLEGERQWQTAPYYSQLLGLDIGFRSSRTLRQADICVNNAIGQWTNENVLVRLFAVLESHHAVLPSIIGSLPGADDIDLLRRLRNVIVHKSGRYDPGDSKDEQLMVRLAERFGVDPGAAHFPLPIDTVVDPLFESARTYTMAWASSNAETQERGHLWQQATGLLRAVWNDAEKRQAVVSLLEALGQQ